MSGWIRVQDRLPEEGKKFQPIMVDVVTSSGREVDLEFYNGQFHFQVTDKDGDFDYMEQLSDGLVLYWMLSPELPINEG